MTLFFSDRAHPIAPEIALLDRNCGGRDNRFVRG
jgi:hypothetical protein